MREPPAPTAAVWIDDGPIAQEGRNEREGRLCHDEYVIRHKAIHLIEAIAALITLVSYRHVRIVADSMEEGRHLACMRRALRRLGHEGGGVEKVSEDDELDCCWHLLRQA